MASLGDENHQVLDNKLYYDDLIKYLKDPNQVGNSSDSHWVKAQAANYCLKDGVLYYGKRKPRKVVLDDETKYLILKQIHVDETKGCHNGIKKMHSLLQKEYFWRYSYKTVTEYVQNCAVCKKNESPLPNLKKNSIALTPWAEVEYYQIKITETTDRKSLFVVLFDPSSLWVSAVAIKPYALKKAEFILENFCNFGIASCTVYGLNSIEFMDLQEEFTKLLIESDIGSDLPVDTLKFSEEIASVEYNNSVKEKIESYLHDHTLDWDKRASILSWLWKLRNEMFHGASALNIMANRCLAKRKNNFRSFPKIKKTTKQSTCLYCDDDIDSDNPLHLHSRCGISNGRQTRSSATKHSSLETEQNGSSQNAIAIPSSDSEISTSSTVATVRALIAEAKEAHKPKEERNKRGEYRRYTPEVREAIAMHALRHGTHDAARTFSTSLGFPVSYSSVRNFVQAHHAFSAQLKLEIGRYAAECGIDAAQKFYTTKLNKPISTALLRKFRRVYLRTTPASPLIQNSGMAKKSNAAMRNLFCTSVREEIGKYAASHGIPAAVRHFSEKLQFSVKESTVRKFKKTYANSSAVEARRSQPPATPPQPSSSPPSRTAVNPIPPPSSLSTLQQTSESNYYNQSYSHFAGAQYNNSQPMNNFHSHHQNLYGVAQPVPPYPSYSTLPPPPQYQSSVQLPAYSRNWNEVCSEVSEPVLQHANNAASQSCMMNSHPSPPPNTATVPSPPSLTTLLPPSLEPNSAKRCHKQGKAIKPKKTTKKSGRGNYATYTPEVRLEIGRFAVEYGCHEAIQHFKVKLGHEIPESTVRGLRDKFVAQQRTCDEVSSLNVLPRGRPLRLGTHDAAVQECIRELKRSGEHVNAFVAIATARQVLLQREPSLLSEFGGHVKLTTNWAKSFLKRIDISNENPQEKTSENHD